MRTYSLTVGMILLLSGCPWQRHAYDLDSQSLDLKLPGEELFECSDDIPAEAFANCRCDHGPKTRGPGNICVDPVIHQRLCLIDSSCNVYPHDLKKRDVLEPDTDRDDIAIRWEWAEPLPLDADLSVNMPEPGDASFTQSPLSFSGIDLSGIENPVIDGSNFPFPGPDTWLDAEVIVDEDRRGFTIVPKQRCFSGRWLLRTEMDLDQIYGRETCESGVPNLEIGGYAANFALE
jgi:hypothetical protein